MCSSAFGSPWTKILGTVGFLKLTSWLLLSPRLFRYLESLRLQDRATGGISLEPCIRISTEQGVLLSRGISLREDEIQELLAEVRGGVYVVPFNLHVVQILKPKNIPSAEFGNNTAEEEPQLCQPGSSVLYSWVGEWQVHVDAV